MRQNYYAVKLYKNKSKKNIPIHKLVAKTFIENPENKPCVNHKDGNKLNNNVENLEWCTHSENTKHAYNMGLEKVSEMQRQNCRNIYKLGNEKNKKKVIQYNANGSLVRKWECIADVQKELNISTSSISACCKGKRKKAGGYIWKYV